MVAEMDPEERLGPEVEQLLLEVAEDFIDSVASFSSELAKHRGSKTLDVQDIALHLEKYHNLRVPGFGDQVSTARPLRKPDGGLASHRKRLAMVARARQQEEGAAASRKRRRRG